MSFVTLKDVYKRYHVGEVTINAADGMTFDIEKGELAVIVGPSGSGKTTVLNMLGGMDSSDEGEITVDGQRIDRYNRKQLTLYRRFDIGFIFQFYNLLPNLTAKENVEIAAQTKKDYIPAEEILAKVGLADRLNNFPAQLSGGEQQRVSIARALSKKPKLLLCDEPTGALDYNTGKMILKLLQDTCRADGMTVILVTHNTAITPMADRVIKIKNSKVTDSIITSEPLFKSQKEYDEFLAAHDMDVPRVELSGYTGAAYLGIDSGSTTTKLVLISEDGAILFSSYSDNNGRPLDLVVRELKKIYELLPSGACIKGCCVTGYGEDLIKSALHADFGVVETVAHFKAALYFNPDVDFIIDIGGQDIKCFKIKNKAIDSIMLNEACSSGCGSFIQTFARAMNMDVAGFSRLGLFARHPVELGSRCTVFMNSAVKQAQKEGASVEDISAGLSTSIVKNAVYKVIRATSIDQLGDNIVVQGGTFLNDAVLRAFEREVGKKVVRPAISGLMGAFGAALYAKENAVSERSAVLTEQEVKDFSYTARSANCGGCTSRCDINIVTFSDGKKHVSGNKCERGAGLKPSSSDLDMYAYKQRLLADCLPKVPFKNPKATVGLPLQSGMYEQLPLWATFFARLGFQPVLSDPSSRDLYFLGQHTVASDTICYPAKLMHGHIESLLDKGVDFIFLPCESYNLDEHASVNHYNCPVVAYYSESLLANNERLTHDNFIMPYVDLNMTSSTVKNLTKSLSRYGVKQGEVKKALQAGFEALEEFHAAIRTRAQYILSESQRQNKPLIVLAGRPYHVDAEINHGINKLLTSLGLAVLTEDGAAALTDNVLVNVINQWTYHARLYKAANFVCTHPCAHLVQLVSFGCGIDAVTTDEIRSIMEKNDELYTQIKIDEINNLGVVKIRLRSMLAAIEEAQKAGIKRN